MEIVTGKIGTPHVSSADDRAFHAAIFGVGNYVLNVGSQFKATIKTSNNIVLADGDLVINGTHARIPHGVNDTVIIENGTTGYNRIDLIVARYTKSSGLESVELAVIKGETVSGTPTRPSYTEGNVLADAEIAEMPLYAVQLAGVNVASITPLFTVATGLDDVYRKNEIYNKNETYPKDKLYTKTEVLKAVYPVGAIYMSVNNVNPSTLFGGTWVAWGSGRVPVGVDTSQAEFKTIEKTGGEKTHTLTQNEIPEHRHSVSLNANHTHKVSSFDGKGYVRDLKTTNVTLGNDVPAITGYGCSDQTSLAEMTISGNTGYTGGSESHNNLQPYITCYMWKRTA